MSHSYDITCSNCNNKFCECHPIIYSDKYENEQFCCLNCKEEYEDNIE